MSLETNNIIGIETENPANIQSHKPTYRKGRMLELEQKQIKFIIKGTEILTRT